MRHLVVLFAACLLAACAAEQADTPSESQPALVQGELSVSSAWIRTAPPSSGVSAGYMTVNNGLAAATSLVGATSARFAAVEFHQMTMKDGQMRMRPLSDIAVMAMSRETLEPGGKHLMLFDPLSPPLKGERILVTFTVQNSAGQQDELDVWFLVRDTGPNE